jgi:hypothetical protein
MRITDQFHDYPRVDGLLDPAPVHGIRVLAQIDDNGFLTRMIIAEEFGLPSGGDADIDREVTGGSFERHEADEFRKLLRILLQV